jgi:hypothetical protein
MLKLFKVDFVANGVIRVGCDKSSIGDLHTIFIACKDAQEAIDLTHKRIEGDIDIKSILFLHNC